MSAEMLPGDLLKRKAIVYVRQSTQTQVQTNLESKRRQYDLVELARRHGFSSVEVIDDDLGRSASVRCPGSNGHSRLEEFQSIGSFLQTQQVSDIRCENVASVCCRTPRCTRVWRSPPPYELRSSDGEPTLS
jgi:hypothetical protein